MAGQSHAGRGRMVAAGVLLALATAGCEQARVSGEVVDALTGEPLEGVGVKVQGTQFQAASRKDGRYAVEYAPGEVALDFEKQGFLPARYTAAAPARRGVPAERVRLYRVPPAPGLFLVDSAARGYRALATAGTCSASTSVRGRYGNTETEVAYSVPGPAAGAPQVAPGRITLAVYQASEIPEAEHTPFLSRSGEGFELLKVEADGSVLRRRVEGVPVRDVTRKIKPWERTDVGGGLRLVEYELPAGVYAFVNTYRARPDQAAVFQVGTPATQPSWSCTPRAG